MENHPIPQDITGFQFKLIGSLTVKQFAYLAGSIVLAWVAYILPLPLILKIPIGLFLIISGVCLAFLPIGGRPMDLMLGNLLKALFSPTQYIYKKAGGDISKAKISKTVTVQTQPEPVVKHHKARQQLHDPLKKTFTFPTFEIHMPKKADEKPKTEHKEAQEISEAELQKEYEEARELERQLAQAKEEEKEAEGKPTYEEAHEKAASLSSELQKTVLEKEALERQLLELQKKLVGQSDSINPFGESTNQSPPAPAEKAPPPQAISAQQPGILSPEAPNVIMGIIKDARGNPLSNILVEVKDAEGNPVRAFKTNGLGQFASATSLSNGAYTISFEDPKGEHKFDAVSFQAAGELIPPVGIVSVDAREELRRELFT